MEFWISVSEVNIINWLLYKQSQSSSNNDSSKYTTKLDENDKLNYVFETVNNGENTCKSPAGMFDDIRIDNSLKVVKDAIIEYEN